MTKNECSLRPLFHVFEPLFRPIDHTFRRIQIFSWETTRGITPENCAESIPHGLNVPWNRANWKIFFFWKKGGGLVQLPVITPESGRSEVVVWATSLLRDRWSWLMDLKKPLKMRCFRGVSQMEILHKRGCRKWDSATTGIAGNQKETCLQEIETNKPLNFE